MKKSGYLFVLLFCFSVVKAQNNIENLSNQILQNNKSVSAYKQYIESVKLSAKTGIFPQNPSFEFNYLLGNPTEIGNQKEFALTQSFDFPSMYFQKGKLSSLQLQQADLKLKLFQKNVLTQIKLACIEQIYLNRRKKELQKRFDNAGVLNNSFQAKFSKGEINQIEFNNAQMQFITAKNLLLTIENQININNKKLTWLNGGISMILNDSIFPVFTEYVNFDSISNRFIRNNISLQIALFDAKIADQEISLQVSNSLPKFEVGYKQETIGNQSLKGIHAGVSIPLWENTNKVKAQKAMYLYQKQEFENLQQEKLIELQQNYATLLQIDKMLKDSKLIIEKNISPALLKQQLESGLISIIAYYTELSNYNLFLDNYEEMQKEYYMKLIEIQQDVE